MIEALARTLDSLKTNGFKVEFVANSQIAKNSVLQIIPENALVGIGDSATIRQISILDELKEKKIEVINPFSEEIAAKIMAKIISREQRIDMLKKAVLCDVYLTGTNAVTTDGKLVNIDGVGNRVAGMIFGPRKAIIVVGRNKIVDSVDEALLRIKNVIAPVHAKAKNYSTPCAFTGKCSNCSSKERICNITVIMERKPIYSDITVLVVDEDLGLGWDQSWPLERINRILARYEEVTFVGRPYWIKNSK